MAPVIENWTDIEGKVKSLRDVDEPAGHAAAEIAVSKAVAVKGFANLVGDRKTLTVHVRKGAPAEAALKTGGQVRLRVRQSGPNKFYAHPDLP
jgi:hypothetical protein